MLPDVPWRWRDVLIGLAPLVLARVAGVLLHAASLPSPAPWLGLALTLAAEVWMLAYPLAVARKREGAGWFPSLPRPRSAGVEFLIALACLPPVVVGLGLAVRVVGPLVGDAGPGAGGPLAPLARALNPGETVALVALAVVAAPLAEEVFFRGMLFGTLRQRLPLVAAVVLQGAVFGAIHPYGRASAVGIALVGIVLALVYRWRRTILAPMLMHALVNAVGMAAMFWALAADAAAPRLGVFSEAVPGGCRIIRVAPGSGAEAAGLRPGDVIIWIDETQVLDPQSLSRAVREHRAGDTVEVEFRRGGEEHVVDARVGSVENPAPAPARSTK